MKREVVPGLGSGTRALLLRRGTYCSVYVQYIPACPVWLLLEGARERESVRIVCSVGSGRASWYVPGRIERDPLLSDLVRVIGPGCTAYA